jgi:betaine lipid synthase
MRSIPITFSSNNQLTLTFFQFYQGQADVYDKTRARLLRGRHTMLSLCASHLRTLRASSPSKRLVWVDIGGGTGVSLFIDR